MSAAIGVLWRHVVTTQVAVQEKLDECERERTELWQVIAKANGARDKDEVKRLYLDN